VFKKPLRVHDKENSIFFFANVLGNDPVKEDFSGKFTVLTTDDTYLDLTAFRH
jgi:hypothetical protein